MVEVWRATFDGDDGAVGDCVEGVIQDVWAGSVCADLGVKVEGRDYELTLRKIAKNLTFSF